jgi:hypothetical protein
MRKSIRVSAPLFVISLYYAATVAAYYGVQLLFPEIRDYMPVGGLQALLESSDFEQVTTGGVLPMTRDPMIQLALGILAATLMMVPVSWMYFITTPNNRIDRSFAQTMMILPVIVAGIAMLVQNSLALAFSLAGVVAAVRFRFTLKEPAHTLYIFVAIAIGLGAGVAAVGISLVVSIGFVYGTLILWIIDYGARLHSPFFSFLTSRDLRDDDELR